MASLQQSLPAGTFVSSFRQALELMRHGMKARREAWPDGVTITRSRGTAGGWNYVQSTGAVYALTLADIKGED